MHANSLFIFKLLCNLFYLQKKEHFVTIQVFFKTTMTHLNKNNTSLTRSPTNKPYKLAVREHT